MGAACGIVFVALFLLATFMVPAPPASNASVLSIRGYFALHHDALIWTGVFWMLALPAFLGFLGAVRAQCEGALGEHVLFGSALVFAGLAMAGATITATLTQHNFAAVATQSVFAIGVVGQAPMLAAIAVFLAAGATIIVQAGAETHWLAWLGYAFAACNMVASLGIIVTDTTALGVLRYIGLLGFALWVLSISVLTYGHHIEAPATTRRGAGVAHA